VFSTAIDSSLDDTTTYEKIYRDPSTLTLSLTPPEANTPLVVKEYADLGATDVTKKANYVEILNLLKYLKLPENSQSIVTVSDFHTWLESQEVDVLCSEYGQDLLLNGCDSSKLKINKGIYEALCVDSDYTDMSKYDNYYNVNNVDKCHSTWNCDTDEDCTSLSSELNRCAQMFCSSI